MECEFIADVGSPPFAIKTAAPIEVPPAVWDDVRQTIKAKVVFDADERLRISREIAARKNPMLQIYNAAPNKEGLTSEVLDGEID